ncbi:MAG: hypothetical protein K0R66_976 [Gammaproteobacteria bacterium]|jgi:hypothetical protein|nr:hypothetical protein [Gammaproteobacteria bacterium]
MEGSTPIHDHISRLPHHNLKIKIRDSNAMDIICDNPEGARFCYDTVYDICDFESQEGRAIPFSIAFDSAGNIIHIEGNIKFCQDKLQAQKINFSISYESEATESIGVKNE